MPGSASLRWDPSQHQARLSAAGELERAPEGGHSSETDAALEHAIIRDMSLAMRQGSNGSKRTGESTPEHTGSDTGSTRDHGTAVEGVPDNTDDTWALSMQVSDTCHLAPAQRVPLAQVQNAFSSQSGSGGSSPRDAPEGSSSADGGEEEQQQDDAGLGSKNRRDDLEDENTDLEQAAGATTKGSRQRVRISRYSTDARISLTLKSARERVMQRACADKKHVEAGASRAEHRERTRQHTHTAAADMAEEYLCSPQLTAGDEAMHA